MFAFDFILVLGLLGGAGDASSEGSEEVGGVHCRGGDSRRQLEAWKDVLPVEAGAPRQKFSVIQGNGEMTLSHLSLVDFDAPKGEQFDVSIDVPLVEILVPAMLMDMLLSSCPSCQDQGKGGGQVHCEDFIAKERGGQKGAEAFEVCNAASIHGGSGEGGHFLNSQAVGNVPGWRDSHLDGAKGCLVVNMMGKAEGPFPTRHPTLSVGQRRVPPNF